MTNMKAVFSLASLCLALQFGLIADTTDRAAGRLLDQAAWGPTPRDVATVKTVGLGPWLDQQFLVTLAPLSDLPDQVLLDARGNTNTDLSPVRSVFFQNTVNNSDQLRQRIAFILSQLWVVSQQAGTVAAYAYPPYWRVLRDNAFLTYSDVIKNVTLNPAMGRYLNMANNNKASAGKSPNENYARELMQLFTLGLAKLNPDGSQMVDGTGAPVPTYSELDVEALARAFTGWTYPTAPGAAARTNNPEYYFGQMIPVEANHDTSAKVIFGITIPAGQTATQDLTAAIRILMQQPTMAPFVSRQLIEHMVTSNPSPQYVSRVSSVFTSSGGDMKSVIKAILLDTEARLGDDPAQSIVSSYGHLREPILLMANLLRGLNATVTATNAVNNYTSSLGENLFDEPSVFSYFSPASRTERGLYGPEFQIYSTQTAPARSNTIYTLIYGTLDSTTRTNLIPFNAVAADPVALAKYISSVFLYNSASTPLLNNMAAAARAASSQTRAVQSALFVMLTSAEYQVIH